MNVIHYPLPDGIKQIAIIAVASVVLWLIWKRLD